MNWWRGLFGVVGLAAATLGAGLLFAPNLVAIGPVEQLLGSIDRAGSDRVLLIAGGGVVAYLLIALRTPKSTHDEGSPAERFDSSPVVTGDQVTASGIDSDVGTAIETGGAELDIVREQLRTTAVTVYSDATGQQASVAREAVERGEWCRDSAAAAFLAGPDGPSPSLLANVRLFVLPERERRRRIERTISAIEGLEQP